MDLYKRLAVLLILFFPVIACLTSCSEQSTDSEGSGDFAELPDFSNVINEAGIGDIGPLGQTAAWGDFNNDGCQDLFIANTDDFDMPNVFLFKNNCNGTFTDVTLGSGIFDEPIRSSSWADFDSDGLVDLIVGTIMVSDPPILYKNLDGNLFLDVTEEAGINRIGSTTNHVLWADYDLDGFVDFFQAGVGLSFLYHNEGDGTFSDVTEESGLSLVRTANSAIWFDSDEDGFPDLFITGNDSSMFYINNGDKTFTEIAGDAGLAEPLNLIALAACPADFNNDGLVDLYVINLGPRNTLYRNDGGNKFSDVTAGSGAEDVGDARNCAVVDFDGDGWIDIISTHHFAPTKLFRNLGNETFVDVTSQLGVNLPSNVFAAAWADFNRDGFMDGILTGHMGDVLLQNGGTSSNFLIFELVGDGVNSNVSAIGAKVSVSSSSGVQVREVSGGKGCCDQDMLPVHFGLGNDRLVDIVVDWPGGGSCFFSDVDVDGGRFYTIFQDGCDIAAS